MPTGRLVAIWNATLAIALSTRATGRRRMAVDTPHQGDRPTSSIQTVDRPAHDILTARFNWKLAAEIKEVTDRPEEPLPENVTKLVLVSRPGRSRDAQPGERTALRDSGAA